MRLSLAATFLSFFIVVAPNSAKAVWSPWEYFEVGGGAAKGGRSGVKVADPRKGQSIAIICMPAQNQLVVAIRNGPRDNRYDKQRAVTWRVDLAPAVSTTFMNLDQGGAGLFDPNQVRTFMSALRFGRDNVLIRSNGDTIEAPLDGSASAIGELIEACPLVN